MSSPYHPLRNLWELTKWKLDNFYHCPNLVFNQITSQCLELGCREIRYMRSWQKFEEETNHLSRSMTSQLLVENTTIKWGSVGSRNDWVNRANITNNPHLPIQGNGQPSTNRAALLEERNPEARSNSSSFWDVTCIFHPETSALARRRLSESKCRTQPRACFFIQWRL